MNPSIETFIHYVTRLCHSYGKWELGTRITPLATLVKQTIVYTDHLVDRIRDVRFRSNGRYVSGSLRKCSFLNFCRVKTFK